MLELPAVAMTVAGAGADADANGVAPLLTLVALAWG